MNGLLFQTLLRGTGIDPATLALCLHKPADPVERTALALMAESEPALFYAYQSTHPKRPEATLKSRAVMASFLARGQQELVFLGLFRRESWVARPGSDYAADPLFQAMIARLRGARHVDRDWWTVLDGRLRFDLSAMDALSDLVGRLVVRDPGARAYMRLAETTPLPVVWISRTPDLSPPMPDWRDLEIDCATLRAIPRTWAERLRHWRGIYLITDQSDGARYVGAAYGADNLLARWQAHVAREVGVTVRLALRDPHRFRFTILELLSPAAGIEEVTAAEQSWMQRLDTRRFGLNA